MAKRAFAYSITISQVGPIHDPDWASASAEVKAEVKRWIVVYGLKEKDAELARGVDVQGVPLVPIAPSTREHRESEMGPADPDAPPLMPAYAASRTRLLLEGEATTQGARFWWGYDANTGGEWGQILDYHRKGIGKRGHKIKRDVIGISEASLARVRDQVMARWLQWKRDQLRAGWSPPRQAITAPPPRLVTTGRTDYTHFTYGIGTTGAPAAGVQATGFFQRRPGTGWTAQGGPNGGGRGRPFEPEPPLGPGNPWWRKGPGGTGPKPKPPTPPAPGSGPTEAARAVEALGYRVRQVTAEEMGGRLGGGSRNAAAAWDRKTGEVAINRESTYWTNPAEEERLKKLGWSTGYGPGHIATHEVGHGKHWESLLLAHSGDETAARRRDVHLSDLAEWQATPEREALQRKARKLLGRNPASSPAEFVADVFAAIVHGGKRYPQWVLDLYRAWNGPPIPGVTP